jgi:hypothetical protein
MPVSRPHNLLSKMHDLLASESTGGCRRLRHRLEAAKIFIQSATTSTAARYRTAHCRRRPGFSRLSTPCARWLEGVSTVAAITQQHRHLERLRLAAAAAAAAATAAVAAVGTALKASTVINARAGRGGHVMTTRRVRPNGRRAF